MDPSILICPNAFKGSLTAMEAAQAMAEGIARLNAEWRSDSISDPHNTNSGRVIRTTCLPLADGGDGTLETLVEATGGTIHRESVRGPLGEKVEAAWGRLGGSQSATAVIEMAQASGLRLLRETERDPIRASTYGTGQLMRAAFNSGCRLLMVCIGGSATNDGGAGMAQALGARLLDEQGRDLPPGGAALRQLARIDLSRFDMPAGVRVIVACDVDNPLYGPEGASVIYGPQKGAAPEQVRLLDEALVHFGSLLNSLAGREVAAIPGAGAAGGLGAGLMAFCQAELGSGTERVLEVTGFDAHCKEAALVLTGEGRLDGQTARGKLIAGVARHAQSAGVPCAAIAGDLAEGAEETLRSEGLSVAISLTSGPISREHAMHEARGLLVSAAERVARLLTLWR